MIKNMSLSFILVLAVLLSACSSPLNIFSRCPDADINWADVLMINDVLYEGLLEGGTYERGKKIGEVKFTLAEKACLNHKLKNGDAAFLDVGTPIYELVGYNSDFRVLAGNKVYQVDENDKAKTVSDLLDIKGKVERMSLESDYDGRHISDFSEQETTDFINDLLTLEYVGYEKVDKGSENDKRVFLRIHLEDGSSFRVVYWLESNALTIGAFGTEKMKEIMENKVNNK